MHLFHNNGDGTFSDVTRKSGLMGETGGLNLVLTDYNNDGHPDVLVLRGGWWGKQGCYPLSLLRNNGDGTFDDVTEQAGLLSAHPTNTAATADFDNDGWLDIFVGHESRPGDVHPSQLFHNNRDGTFTDIAPATGLANLGFVKGAAWGDFNLDGRPDLYVSVMYGHNHLFRNDGPRDPHDSTKGWRFTDVTEAAGVGLQSNSFATWFFDYDNDGWPDLFVAGYSLDSSADVGAFELGRKVHAELPRLYRNNHDGTFSDVTAAAHLDRTILAMGAGFGDLDNDGWLDLYLGTGDSTYQALLPNRLFRNAEGRTFQDVTTAADLGSLQKGHGVAFADLRGTGFEDIFEEMGGAQPGDTFQSALYRNPGNRNHSITLLLEGVRSNRAAFGARIDVAIKPSPALPLRHIYRTVGFGSSFGGNPLRQHIGIGAATRVSSITVTWPTSGTVDRLHDIPADRTYKLREGDNSLTPLPLR
ncbi:MAG: CRTAC1 family protein [Acidobacteriota bacterium]|nr:CRTAC1 family protein [Acidobacteriota bacterium]